MRDDQNLVQTNRSSILSSVLEPCDLEEKGFNSLWATSPVDVSWEIGALYFFVRLHLIRPVLANPYCEVQAGGFLLAGPVSLNYVWACSLARCFQKCCQII
jgi:hypothetical protein